jgi:hypothetical protein
MQAQRKSGPMCWGHYSKRQKGGKSGKTLQGVVLASRATIRKLSRTMCCGEGHVAMCSLFCCSEIQHLPRQRFLSHRSVTEITLSVCSDEVCLRPRSGMRGNTKKSCRWKGAHYCTFAAGHCFTFPERRETPPRKAGFVGNALLSCCPPPSAACRAGSDTAATVR